MLVEKGICRVALSKISFEGLSEYCQHTVSHKQRQSEYFDTNV